MKWFMIVMMTVMFSGCTPTIVEFIGSHTTQEDHEANLKALDSSYGQGTVVF